MLRDRQTTRWQADAQALAMDAVSKSACIAQPQEFLRLADDMMAGRPTDSGPTPPNMIQNQWSFLPPVVIDTAPIGQAFSSVLTVG